MSLKIGQKLLWLLSSEKLRRTIVPFTVAAVVLSSWLTGCGKKYEAIDLTEFETGKNAEMTASETEFFDEAEFSAENEETILYEAFPDDNTGRESVEMEMDAESIGETQTESFNTDAEIELEESDVSEVWNGHVVAIDAGHQAKANLDKEPIGPDAETMKAKMEESAVGTTTGIREYELTLTVAQKLEHILEEHGYRVVMLRESNDINLSNAERSIIANESGAEILLRLHANSMENSSVYGVLAMCMTEYNPYNASLHAESYALSKKLVDQIGMMTGTKNRGVQQVDNLSAINWCEIPVSVIEMGFLSNPVEERWLESEEYQDKIVSGIVVAVDSYFETVQS